MSRKLVLATLSVFFISFVGLSWLFAARWSFCYDEGIYIDGARRILNGQAPYRDFFALTGPGTYWFHAAAFRVLGESLASARIPVILDSAVMLALGFWLTARLSHVWLGLLVVAYAAVRWAAPYPLFVPNHRFDSSAAAMVALCAGLAAADGQGGRLPKVLCLLSGLAAAWAAWSTPTVGLVIPLMGAWLIWRDRNMRLAAAFLAGVVTVFLGGWAWLASHHAVTPMLRSLVWTASNYEQANAFPYGGVIGGYAGWFRDASGLELVWRALPALFLAVPALVPVVAIVGWSVYLWRAKPQEPLRQEAVLLILFTAAMVASTYPRMDLDHLAYFLPASAAAAATVVEKCPAPRLKAVSFLGLVFVTSLVIWYYAPIYLQNVALQTPVGKIVGRPDAIRMVASVMERVPERRTLFVYPYAPVFYFLRNGVNPTRYSYLQPGMMTAADEAAVLADLTRNPPEFVLEVPIPEEDFLRIWPGTDRARLRMNRIEHFLQTRYEEVAAAPRGVLPYRVLRRLGWEHDDARTPD